ncbi:MAG: glycosyltransferase family 2 protein [Clostridia bacterium]|nr:glycosyltransferase family 2 protein [Clostridia bacterium]
MNNIAVSFIVPIYNRQDRLDRCIDSLVYQSLDNIEILLVDDHSTDNSYAIMEAWHARFPEKIRLLKTEGKGVAYAKNTGIRAAKGQYVLFVDSDDYTDYKTAKRLYDCAEQNDFPEMVYSPITRVYPSSMQLTAKLEGKPHVEDYLKLSFHFLHGKLIRTDLFERFGELPLLGVGEDVSWVFPVISHLNTIAYCDLPCYFYELAPDSITLNGMRPNYIEDIIAGSERIIEKSNPVYREHALVYAYQRIVNLNEKHPVYSDVITRYLLEHAEEIESIANLETRSPALYRALSTARSCSGFIPKTAYLNGFASPDAAEQIDSQALFLGDSRVVVLSESNCDLTRCPETVKTAFANGNMEFVGHYFALTACYEQGGIYVSGDLIIDNPLNALLTDPSFFGFESNQVFTDKIFGGCAGNPVLRSILDTYRYPDLYEDPFAPLSSRIKTVLVGMGNVPLVSSQLRSLNYGFCLYPVDMFVYTLPYARRPQISHYKPELLQTGETVQIPAAILNSLGMRHVKLETERTKRERDNQKKRANHLEWQLRDFRGSILARIGLKVHRLYRKIRYRR